MGARRLFLAYFGGNEPRPSLTRTMDHAIVTGYAIAVRSTGGMVLSVEERFELTADEAYALGEIDRRPNATAARQVIETWRTGTAMYPKVSENTWISASPSLSRAIRHTLAYAHPGDVLGELLLFDHGVEGADGEFIGMSFGTDFLSPDTLFSQGHAEALKQLRPLVDGGTIVTLAGCKVASNAVGRRLLSEIAGLLGVRTQGFVEDQYVSALRPGIEGQTISCGASVCRPSSVTPFASTIYGSPEAYGNVDPGWE